MKLGLKIIYLISIVSCACIILLAGIGLYTSCTYEKLCNIYISGIFVFIICSACIVLLAMVLFSLATRNNMPFDNSLHHTLLAKLTHFPRNLVALFSSFTIKNRELISILNEMKEEILVISDLNTIMYYNASFANHFIKTKNVLKKDYREIITNKNFISLIESIHNSKKQYIQKEITIQNITYLLSLSVVGSKKVMIIVFHDISENEALEKIKKDFIVNASHELRTPLTAIKGYLELVESNPTNNQKYIEIISRNTDRIINIVNDLLKLSKLESDNTVISYEKFELVELIKNIAILFAHKLTQKRLSLNFVFQTPSIIIEADKLKIEEVFINLIDNAIKYTEEGTITIYSAKKQDMQEIRIIDTGIGIPKKYLSRIFERFFVVDKARSRKTGGTGLGLAIVKHIVQLHNGYIDIRSAPNIGTEFLISIPLSANT